MTKTLTKQTTQACVLDQQGKPLMPTTRLGKVYRLLKTQKAHIVSHEPFTIQLNYEPDTHIIQPMTLTSQVSFMNSLATLALKTIATLWQPLSKH